MVWIIDAFDIGDRDLHHTKIGIYKRILYDFNAATNRSEQMVSPIKTYTEISQCSNLTMYENS